MLDLYRLSIYLLLLSTVLSVYLLSPVVSYRVLALLLAFVSACTSRSSRTPLSPEPPQTLLDILAGRCTAGKGLKGEVRVNGTLVDGPTMRGLAGYVMQVCVGGLQGHKLRVNGSCNARIREKGLTWVYTELVNTPATLLGQSWRMCQRRCSVGWQRDAEAQGILWARVVA